MTFSQQTEMQKLIHTLARMDLPTDNITDEDIADGIMADLDEERLSSDANALYDLIVTAREILKGKRQ